MRHRSPSSSRCDRVSSFPLILSCLGLSQIRVGSLSSLFRIAPDRASASCRSASIRLDTASAAFFCTVRSHSPVSAASDILVKAMRLSPPSRTALILKVRTTCFAFLWASRRVLLLWTTSLHCITHRSTSRRFMSPRDLTSDRQRQKPHCKGPPTISTFRRPPSGQPLGHDVQPRRRNHSVSLWPTKRGVFAFSWLPLLSREIYSHRPPRAFKSLKS